jgi:tetratricopeptide (TPR) repeat protein
MRKQMMPSTRLRPFADRRGLVALGAALAMLAATPLHAQDIETRPAPAGEDKADPEARRLAERGLAHYEAGRYREAIDDFEASYRITQAPGLLYNLAQAQRLKGDCATALALYRRFLAANPTGNIRQLTETRIRETEQCATDDRQSRAPATAPMLTPAIPAATPAAPPALLQMAAPPAAAAPSPRWRRPVGVAAGVAAVVCGVAGGVYATRAGQAADDVSAIYARGGTWGPYAMERQASGQHDQRFALVFGSGALVAAAVSLWLLVDR